VKAVFVVVHPRIEVKFKRAIVFVTVAVFVGALPVYPIGKLLVPDPVDTNDSRVAANISNSDLDDIVSQVRKPTWGGVMN